MDRATVFGTVDASSILARRTIPIDIPTSLTKITSMTARIEKSRSKNGGAHVFGDGRAMPLVSDRLNVGHGNQLHFYKFTKGKGWQFVVAQGTNAPETVRISPHKKLKGFRLSWGDYSNPRSCEFSRGARLKVEKRGVTHEGRIKTTRQFVKAT